MTVPRGLQESSTFPDADLATLLELEQIEPDIFRANLVFEDQWHLYGGQVAAQALMAAGRTVTEERRPHSLHGYFLRPGDASIPTIFVVDRDRDGRSFSARRVVARQNGKVIFSMAASFTDGGPDLHRQANEMPQVPAPEECPVWEIPRMFSLVGAVPPAAPGRRDSPWPSTFWARSRDRLGDSHLLNACALTYLSDVSGAIDHFDTPGWQGSASLDHAVWFHRPTRVDEWLLTHYTPQTVADGRGLYTGSIFDQSGAVVASVAQEGLYQRVGYQPASRSQ